MAHLEPDRRRGRTTSAARRIGRRLLGTATCRRGPVRRPRRADSEHRPACGTGHPMPMRHLREPVARCLRTAAARMAASSRRRHGLPVGHGRRARTGMARSLRVSLQGQARLRDVRVVRAGSGGARGCARVREAPVHAVPGSSRRDPGPRRETDTTDGPGPRRASGPAARDVRGRPRARRGRPLPVPTTPDVGPALPPVDQRRPSDGGGPSTERRVGRDPGPSRTASPARASETSPANDLGPSVGLRGPVLWN